MDAKYGPANVQERFNVQILDVHRWPSMSLTIASVPLMLTMCRHSRCGSIPNHRRILYTEQIIISFADQASHLAGVVFVFVRRICKVIPLLSSITSNLAQRKRAGLITRRSSDRN